MAKAIVGGDRQAAKADPSNKPGISADFRGSGTAHQHRELGKQGWRPFFVGAVGEVVIAFLTLGLVFGADRLLRQPATSSAGEGGPDFVENWDP